MCHEYIMETILNPLEKTIAQKKEKLIMTVNDILETEQLKYCYEQAYALHRHTEIPAMFVRKTDTVFTLPSAGDRTVGWDVINEKFCGELYYVSPNEDSFHTGWQICTPLLWEDPDGEIHGIFPTFGFLVLSMDPETMKPPYPVLSTLELWQDRFARSEGHMKIHYLQAQFLLGQCVHRWDPAGDTGFAVRKLLREIPHPVLGRSSVNAAGTTESSGNLLPEDSVSNMTASVTGSFGGMLYGVQSAMSLYTLLWQCGRMQEIPEQLFCDAEDISASYDKEENAENRSAVKAFYRKMQDKIAGDTIFLRVDMPATQWIEASEDGQSAAGRWITMTRKITPSEKGNLYSIGIGAFENTFVRCGGSWKIKSIRYTTLQEFAPYDETPDMNLENYRKNPAGWLPELPELPMISDRGMTERTLQILRLRNEILSWFYRYSCETSGTAVFPCRSKNAQDQIRAALSDSSFILATSPVIRMERDLTKAEAFFSVTLIKDTSSDSMTYVRGSIFITLEKGKKSFEILDFSWYPYASLDPLRKQLTLTDSSAAAP